MRVAKLVSAVVLVVACLGVTGCGSGTDGAVKRLGKLSVTLDSVFVAEKAASAEVAKVAPDAVLLSVGTGGVVLNPPPSSWNFLYGSPGKGRTYRVAVEHGTAEKAEDLAPLDTKVVDLSSVVPISSVKVGSKEAYEAGKAFLEKRDGSAPPNLMMSVSFVEVPGLEGQSVSDWALAFTQGTSTDGMQQVRVDGQTGAASAIE